MVIDHLGLHCRTYNALIEEHRRQYEAGEKALSFSAMCKKLTGWRSNSLGLSGLNAQSLQVTAKRVALAFDAFFRRLKQGDTAGYPRFKSFDRYPGWGYKTHGDGWKFFPNEAKHGKLRLSGIGEIPIRGKGRFAGIPKTCEVIHKSGKWYLSVTFNVNPEAVTRPSGTGVAAFDWGIDTLLPIAKEDGSIETINNPRWLKNNLDAIKSL